jgi:hypothetical protein
MATTRRFAAPPEVGGRDQSHRLRLIHHLVNHSVGQGFAALHRTLAELGRSKEKDPANGHSFTPAGHLRRKDRRTGPAP